jgi:energy-converting hydrogenase Eha subunit B
MSRWTVATIALYVGIALIVAGIVLAIFAVLGFRHARRTAGVAPTAEVA